MSLVATEQSIERIQRLRASYFDWMTEVDPSNLIFIDEAGSTVAMTRTLARAPSGTRAVDDVPRNRGSVITMIGALTVDRLIAMMTIEGGTDRHVFRAYVDEVLGPKLRPGNVVVLDNAGAHKVPEVAEAIRALGCRVRFLPPYSPDLNPIELAWSKLKELLRSAKARCRESLDTAIKDAMEAITPSDARNWTRHCGYAIQAS